MFSLGGRGHAIIGGFLGCKVIFDTSCLLSIAEKFISAVAKKASSAFQSHCR